MLIADILIIFRQDEKAILLSKMLTIDGKPYEEINEDGSKLLQDLLKVARFLLLKNLCRIFQNNVIVRVFTGPGQPGKSCNRKKTF